MVFDGTFCKEGTTKVVTAPNHLERQGTYVRMLSIDYSSAFKTIIPDILISKLSELGLSPSICTWIKNFLTNRPQTVKLGPHLSSTITLSTRLSTRLCFEPSTLLLVHIWLYSHSSHQHNHQICRWYHSDWTHLRRWWIRLQRWSPETRGVVLWKQFVPEHF